MRNGTAVDAAVATLFCDGLLQSASMGPGGGLFMTIYQKSTGTIEILNAREKAPLAATEDMFQGDPNLSRYGTRGYSYVWNNRTCTLIYFGEIFHPVRFEINLKNS